MKTKFGPRHLTTETPKWASWMFRSVFILTTVATFIIASEPTIPDATKVRIGVYLKGFDMLIYMFSKMFGVDVKEEDQDEGKEEVKAV